MNDRTAWIFEESDTVIPDCSQISPHVRGRRQLMWAHVLPHGASSRGTVAGRVARRRPVRIRNRPILDLHAALRRVGLE